MQIAIVGAGAIGCLFGIRLHLSGNIVLLVHHDARTVATIRMNGVRLKEVSGRIIRARIQVKRSLSLEDRPDLVILTVKAYDTEETARDLSKHVKRGTPILSLQNGLGNIESLLRFFSASSVISGTTTEAVQRTGPGLILHKGSGTTWVGKLGAGAANKTNTIARLFKSSGFETRTSKNITGVIWSKAIVNSAINPISALARVSNRDIARIASLRGASLSLVQEGVRVARAHGVNLTPSPTILLSRVLTSSGRNQSSMLQDIEAGRKTEIREINGRIASIGKRLRVDAPLNTLITQLVLALEASRNTTSSRN
ncbi:ketopantoate reductase family protein [Candidatus Bathyarchaeota archaeon]|nr:ketopantoate reductase family protein [Candidatus Bathyarchaeota archaeon]